MDKNMQFSEGLNSLYNKALSQFMNIQMAVSSKTMTRQQATTMLRNVATMLKMGCPAFLKAEGVDQHLVGQYRNGFEDLNNQMKEYLEQELSPVRNV